MKAEVGFALAALACILVAEPLAQRARIPSSVILVAIGVGYAELPGPNIHLDPTLVLTLVLPPLLYSAALQASLVDIRGNLRTVASLSVGLVLSTAFLVAALLTATVPGMPFAVALALGAAVAPPDPVAALSIARRAGMPAKLTTLIEGEGLLNDATALTTYQVAVGAVVGGSLSPAVAAGKFGYAVGCGVAIGALVAWAVRQFRQHITDPLLDNGLSLAVPFGAFIATEAAHGSGVLAVVTAGLLLGQPSGRISSGASRLQTRAVWRLVDFLLEGFVFLLIGQQLPDVLSGLDAYPTSRIAVAAAVTTGSVLLLRPLWLVVTSHLPGRRGPRTPQLSGRDVVAMSWAGTRGVISLAAIFSLPLVADDHPFPQRDLLVFCAYVAVLVTLVGQGLTLGAALRWLALPSDRDAERREILAARAAATQAGAAAIDNILKTEPADPKAAELIRGHVRDQVSRSQVAADTSHETATAVAGDFARLRRLLIDAEREEILRWRDAGRLSEAGLRTLERDLDLQESRWATPH